MLRQCSSRVPCLYEKFKAKNNTFPTTIHVLVSAVVKLARVTKFCPGFKLYRGLGSVSELPEYFYKADELGRRGYIDWGFMSATSNEQIARQVAS